MPPVINERRNDSLAGSLAASYSTKSSLATKTDALRTSIRTDLLTGDQLKSSLLSSPLVNRHSAEIEASKYGVIGGERKTKRPNTSLLSSRPLLGVNTGLTHRQPLTGNLQLTSSQSSVLKQKGLSGVSHVTGGPSLSLGNTDLLSTSTAPSSLLTSLTNKLSTLTDPRLTNLDTRLTNHAATSGLTTLDTKPTSSFGHVSTSSFLPSTVINKTSGIHNKKSEPKITNKKSVRNKPKQEKTKSKKAPLKKLGKRAHKDESIGAKIERPSYSFDEPDRKVRRVERPLFVPPEKDVRLIAPEKPLYDVAAMKHSMLNAVSASLIRAPDFKDPHDATRNDLSHRADLIAAYDPEFILKVALYTRCDLNIRTTGNFMLAYAAHNKLTRPFLRRYYSSSIRLPSDWIDVAEQYQAFFYVDRDFNFGSLPAALRRVMTAKFVKFDKYQLGKYNKESSGKKKKKKEKKEKPKKCAEDAEEIDSEEEDGEEKGLGDFFKQVSQVSEVSDTEEEIERKTFTLKQLIRKLHITEPVEHVMCLIGKRYPETPEDFYKCRLPGTFEEERAGKRMKLPTPETWETQVSMKGNKASTWEDLIDHKKLPFMAMLRNLRNMIQAGISRKHHDWVIKKLTDEGAVTNSRQFPFRFFSAYEVLSTLENQFEYTQQVLIDKAIAATSGDSTRGRGGATRGGRGRGRGGKSGGRKEKPIRELEYDKQLLQRYKKALDTSVKIATVHNVQPIRGRTVIFCNMGLSMDRPCTSARGLGKPRKVYEVGVLLGLMCKYSCEESTMVVYGLENHREVELEKGTVLDNMESLLELYTLLNFTTSRPDHDIFAEPPEPEHATIPQKYMHELLRDRVQVDNFVILSDGMNLGSVEGRQVTDFLVKYRQIVNPNLLFVSVDLSGKSCGFAKDIQPGHANDIYIAGYSDAILRFIAERGDGGQVNYVENIHQAYELTPLATTHQHPTDILLPDPQKPLPVPILAPRWRSARVFISSTFHDMHGERDLLTRFVFPELRARAQELCVNVYEVDLRWGVTEEQTRTNQTLELCLSEIKRSDLFVGILGQRYGWMPMNLAVNDQETSDWLLENHQGHSVTEIEMSYAALRHPDKMADRAFFFLRNDLSEEGIPSKFLNDFIDKGNDTKNKMDELKDKIRHSGLEVDDSYPAVWGGVVDGKAFVCHLEQFGASVLSKLWAAIEKLYPPQDETIDEISHETSLHNAYEEARRKVYVGRQKMLKHAIDLMAHKTNGVVMVSGKPGVGKTSFMAKLVQSLANNKASSPGLNILTHFIGAAPGSSSINSMFRRFSFELKRRFNLTGDVPEDSSSLPSVFIEMTKQAAIVSGQPLYMFIDGANGFDDTHRARNMDWLPETPIENVVFVVSCPDEGETYQALQRRRAESIIVRGLEILDKAEVVRKTLALHRKSLSETAFNNEMKLIVGKKDATSPLYLSLACQELRLHGVFENMTSKLKGLPQTTNQLIQEILHRLESDCGHHHVMTSLSLLYISRAGIQEDDLRGVLSSIDRLGYHSNPSLSEISNIEVTDVTAVPQAQFIHLWRSISDFLNPVKIIGNVDTISVANSSVATAIQQRYLKAGSEDMVTHLHHVLAGYYHNQANPNGDGSWSGSNVAAFRELPYHLLCAKMYQEAEAILCDLSFVEKMCQLNLGQSLLDGYHQALAAFATKSGSKIKKDDKLKDHLDFVSRNMHILAKHPTLVWQQALNDPQTSKLGNKTVLQEAARNARQGLMLWSNKIDTPIPCTMTLSNFSKPVTCLAVSPDERQFACGTEDCLVKIYNMANGKELMTLTGHSDAITSICYVGASRLASASKDKTLSLWDLSDGHRISKMKVHNRSVNSCAADKTGKHLVSVGWDCGMRLFDGLTGKLLHKVTTGASTEQRPLNCVAFHPEGQLIVVGSWDGALKIYDTFHKSRKAVLRGHNSSIRAVAYSPSGCHIASAALDGEVKLWSASHGTQVGTLTGHALPINSLVYSPSGEHLITVSDDQKVKVWSGHLGQPVCHIGHKDGPVTSLCLSPDGETVSAGYHSGKVVVYQAVTGSFVCEIKGRGVPVRALKYARREDLLFIGSDDGSLVHQGIRLNKGTSTILEDAGCILCIATGNRTVAASTESFMTYVWRFGTFSHPYTFQKVMRIGGHIGPVTSCSLNSSETNIVTASRDMSMKVWKIDKSTIHPEKSFDSCHSDWINGCVWSENDQFIVTASNDFNMKLWDMKTGKEKKKFTGHMAAINGVAYSYGCLASACADGSVKVWSQKGIEVTTLHGHTQRANACDIFVKLKKKESKTERVSSDWAMEMDAHDWKAEHDKTKLDKQDVKIDDVIVASCSDDGTIRIWRPLQGNEVATLIGHSNRVTCVASTASNSLCTASLDLSVRQWKPELVAVPKSGETHIGEVTSVSVSKLCSDHHGNNGYYLLSTSRTGEVKIWWLCNYDNTLGVPLTRELRHSFKASDKSVNCSVFGEKEDGRLWFLVGTDCGMICLYSMSADPSFPSALDLRLLDTSREESPITSLELFSSGGTNFVLGTMWRGVVTRRVDFPYITGKPTYDMHEDWVIAGYLKDQLYVTTSCNGSIQSSKLNVTSKEQKTLGAIPDEDLSTEDSNSGSIPWPLCATMNKYNTLCVGDSKGHLHLFKTNKAKNKATIHSGAVTSVAMSGDIMFTGSADSTVKAWHFKDRNSYIQVGQYFCQSPIVSMAIIHEGSASVHIVIGDQHGNVDFLQWSFTHRTMMP